MIFQLKNGSTIYFIELKNLMFCKSEGNYTMFFLKDKKVLSYQSLSKASKFLSIHLFFRCHNSYLVNLREIAEFNMKKNILQLKNNAIIPVSKSKKRYLETALKNFIQDQT